MKTVTTDTELNNLVIIGRVINTRGLVGYVVLDKITNISYRMSQYQPYLPKIIFGYGIVKAKDFNVLEELRIIR